MRHSFAFFFILLASTSLAPAHARPWWKTSPTPSHLFRLPMDIEKAKAVADMSDTFKLVKDDILNSKVMEHQSRHTGWIRFKLPGLESWILRLRFRLAADSGYSVLALRLGVRGPNRRPESDYYSEKPGSSPLPLRVRGPNRRPESDYYFTFRSLPISAPYTLGISTVYGSSTSMPYQFRSTGVGITYKRTWPRTVVFSERYRRVSPTWYPDFRRE